MFGKIFGRKPQSDRTGVADDGRTSAERAMANEVNRLRRSDIWAGAKVGQQDVVASILDALTTEKGVHAEAALAVAGSLAGFACPASVAAMAKAAGKSPEAFGVVVVTPENGEALWYGDVINGPFLENEVSVWAQVIGGAAQLGVPDAADAEDLLRHVASTVGTPAFGMPRIPEGHDPGDTPLAWTKMGWGHGKRLRDIYCAEPWEWPLLYAWAAQSIIKQVKDVVEPGLAARIVLECAAPMTKMNPYAVAPEEFNQT